MYVSTYIKCIYVCIYIYLKRIQSKIFTPSLTYSPRPSIPGDFI